MEYSTPTTPADELQPGQALSIKRYFTSPGVDPFDTVEWETSRRADRPRRPGRLRAEGRRVPGDVVAELDQHRQPEVLPRPARLARPRALGQADDRPRRRHDRRLGPSARLLRLAGRQRRVPRRADPHPAPPDGGLQFARLVQRRLRGAAAVQRLLHPVRRGHDGVDPRLEHQGRQHLPWRLGVGHQPVEHPRLDGAAGQGRHGVGPGVVHARRRLVGRDDQVGRQDAPRGQDGRPRHRSPGHRGVHLVQGARGGQGRGAARRRLRHVDRRRRLQVDPVPERQQLGPRDRRLHARGRERRRLGSDRPLDRRGRQDDTRA